MISRVLGALMRHCTIVACALLGACGHEAGPDIASALPLHASVVRVAAWPEIVPQPTTDTQCRQIGTIGYTWRENVTAVTLQLRRTKITDGVQANCGPNGTQVSPGTEPLTLKRDQTGYYCADYQTSLACRTILRFDVVGPPKETIVMPTEPPPPLPSRRDENGPSIRECGRCLPPG